MSDEASSLDDTNEKEVAGRLEHSARLNSLGDLVDPNQLFPVTPFQTQQIAQPWTFSMGAAYTPFTLNRIALSYGYMTYGLVQDVVDVPVDDAFRGGIELQCEELDQQEIKDVIKAIEEEGDLDATKKTGKWARLYGGAGNVIVTEQNWRTPLQPLRAGDKLKFVDADRWELALTAVSLSGRDIGLEEWAGRVEAPYNYYNLSLDHSRVIRMLGKDAPSFVRQRLQGWGMSELERAIRELNTYIKFQNLLYELVDEAKIDIYTIQNFATSLATAQGQSAIQLRVQLANWIKNYKNALVLDREDTYEQKQIAFSGLADIFEQFRISLCATLRIPYNKLFGMSSSGFASGEDSMENYNAMIDGEIRDKMKPLVREVLKLRIQAMYGFDPKFTFKFQPLRVLNGLEEEQVKAQKQTRTLELYDRDLLNGQEAMESLHKAGLVDVDSEVLAGKREPISPLGMQQDAQEQQGKLDKQKLAIDAKKSKDRANGLERLRTMRLKRMPAWDSLGKAA